MASKESGNFVRAPGHPFQRFNKTSGYCQRKIAREQYRNRRSIERGRKTRQKRAGGR